MAVRPLVIRERRNWGPLLMFSVVDRGPHGCPDWSICNKLCSTVHYSSGDALKGVVQPFEAFFKFAILTLLANGRRQETKNCNKRKAIGFKCIHTKHFN